MIPSACLTQTMVALHACHVALVDNDKANLVNCTEKRLARTIRNWSGQMTRDQRYGLGAPAKGGLYLVDLHSGRNLATFIEPGQEGVFRRYAGEVNNSII